MRNAVNVINKSRNAEHKRRSGCDGRREYANDGMCRVMLGVAQTVDQWQMQAN